MDRQPELQTLLQTLVPIGKKVYFQPPPSIELEYPCIVYKRDAASTKFAGNQPYRYTKRFQVTVIDENPASDIPDKVAALPMCIFNRYFAAGNLNHDVFVIYF